MAIKPILFNSHMVDAILDGRKTVMRRVVKGSEHYNEFCGLKTDPDMLAIAKSGEEYPKRVKGLWAIFEQDGLPQFPMAKAPYEPGDVLWVREPWNYGYFDSSDRELDNSRWFEPLPIDYDRNSYIGAQAGYVYRRDFSYKEECAYGTENEKGELVPMPWRPSIHMPRDAARIWLRVTNVRVERLQDIDEAGAEAEGGQAIIWHGKPERTARDNFELIWGNTLKSTDYNRYGWEANPWVWVIKFERCEKPTCAVSN